MEVEGVWGAKYRGGKKQTLKAKVALKRKPSGKSEFEAEFVEYF